MKRLFAFMLSAVLCLSLLAGCGSGKSTGTSSEASGSTETAETANAAESGELRELDVVLDWYPNALHAFLYEAIDKGYYAEEGLKVNIRFPSNTNDALSLVAAGKADIGLAGMTVTPERQESVDFTASYATGVQVIIVTEDSPITSVDDLFADGASNVIGVQRNTTGDLYTTWDLEDAGLATIDRYSKGADAVQALKTGKVDCVVIDNEPAKAFVAEVEGLKILETEYVLEDYAGAMSKDNTALYEAVNAALQELIADGTVKSIIDTYISAQ